MTGVRDKSDHCVCVCYMKVSRQRSDHVLVDVCTVGQRQVLTVHKSVCRI